jgi:hypothetical protein
LAGNGADLQIQVRFAADALVEHGIDPEIEADDFFCVAGIGKSLLQEMQSYCRTLKKKINI